MIELTVTIPAAAFDRIKAALAYIYPIPNTEPVYDPGTGGILVPPQPMYTEGEWAKRKLKQWIQDQVFRAEAKIKVDQAKAGMDISDLGISVE